MNRVWNSDGVSVSAISTAKWISQEIIITGTGWNKDVPFEWEAVATSHGWHISIIRLSGKIGSYQGSTFNLALEIAVAVKRLM